MTDRRRWATVLGVVLLVAACASEERRTPSLTPAAPTADPSPEATPVAPTETTEAASPTPTPEPNSLPSPPAVAEGVVGFTVSPQLPAQGAGVVLVVVTNVGPTAIEELVLRWPAELRAELALAPFAPSGDRLVPPLSIPWTKWVEGPGAEGEPAGTVSLGWGPLDPGTTLEIPLVADRLAAAPISFDLQLLDGNDLLATTDGQPAELRVEIAP